MSRVFVGIPIGDELRNKITNFAEEHSIFPVRWIEGKNLHITLVPPWKEANIDLILKRLETLEGAFSDVYLEFAEVGFGPNERSPRLIWALGNTTPELNDLTKKVNLLLEFEPPEKDILLHTTLARFRPETFSDFKIKNLKEKINWKMRAEKIILYKSKLRAEGSDYIPLGEINI